MSAEAYHRAEGLSRSMIEDIIPPFSTPLHFHAAHIAKTAPREETPAMRLGTLTHRFILEPETTECAFHIKPKGMSFSTKDGKEWRASRSNLPIISEDDADAIFGMRDAVWASAEARQFLEGARTEQSLFALDSWGTLRKARLDLLPAGGNILADLKTCQTCEERELSKQVDKLGYNRQAAYTLEICRLLDLPFKLWSIICVESSPPYDVVVWPLDQAAVAVGRRECEAAVQTVRHCEETGIWPGRAAGLPPLRERFLTLPSWRQRELDNA